ncbi:large subunit ribosomal protein L13e [Nematocida sp. AWRm80]|nr:large subunit ribosomal protein L13e [Nematocida sp. AWRm80]
MKHNTALNTEQHRKTCLKYKTWFNQPIRAKMRKDTRDQKAKKIAPRNEKCLRPIVNCNTRKYNMKQRYGKGFSYAELHQVELTPKKAMALGIAVDPRRYNHSEEGLERNVARLREYLSKITVYDTVAEAKAAGAQQFRGIIMPIEKKQPLIQSMPASEVDSTLQVYKRITELKKECIYRRAKRERLGFLKAESK